jgi:hypothetical protein
MEHISSFLVTAGLLLLPLVPATALYFILSPKGNKARGAGEAGGDIDTPLLNVGRLRLRFNLVGSSATYVVLLAAAVWIYRDAEANAQSRDQMRAEALKEQNAWLAQVPVMLRTQDNKVIPADNNEMKAVQVELEPTPTWLGTYDTVEFWVVPNKSGKLPRARFSLAGLTLKPELLDLNDLQKVKLDYAGRRIEGVSPVWLEIGPAYGGSK